MPIFICRVTRRSQQMSSQSAEAGLSIPTKAHKGREVPVCRKRLIRRPGRVNYMAQQKEGMLPRDTCHCPLSIHMCTAPSSHLFLASKRNSEKLVLNNTIKRFDATSETAFFPPLTQALRPQAVFIRNYFCLETGSWKPTTEDPIVF